MKNLLFTLLIILDSININAQNVRFEWSNSTNPITPVFGDWITPVKTAIDSSGNIYVAGNFRGTGDFDPGPAILNQTAQNLTDAYIQKFDSNGLLIWAKFIEGANNVYILSMTLDNFDHIIISGRISGQTDFDPGVGTILVSPLTSNAAYILKLTLDGDYVWIKKIEANSTNLIECSSITTDTMGNIYSTGYFQGITDFDPSFNTYNITANGQSDGYVQKLDSNGNLIWVFPLGTSTGLNSTKGRAITIDPFGDIYIAVTFNGLVDADPGSGTTYLPTVGSGFYLDYFVEKVDPNMNFLWAKSVGSNYDDNVRDIVTDNLGYVYITGTYGGTADFDPGVGFFNMSPVPNNGNVFVQKLDQLGNFVWAKTLAGYESMAMVTDNFFNIHITGSFVGSPDFDPGSGTINHTCKGVRDVFLIKLDSNGVFGGVNIFGGIEDDFAIDITTDDSGYLYLIGRYSDTVDFDPNLGIYNMFGEDDYSSYLVKLRNCSTNSSDIIITCGSYTWINGITYTTSNHSATHILPNSMGCDSMITLNLTVINLNSSVTQVGTLLTSNEPEVNYQWLNCPNMTPIIGEINLSYTATVNGDYAVIITNNGCSDTSACYNITTVGVIESNFNTDLLIYPNPTTGNISINLGEFKQGIQATLTNCLGQVILAKQFESTDIINMEIDAPKGIYFLQIETNEGEIKTLKVLKE